MAVCANWDTFRNWPEREPFDLRGSLPFNTDARAGYWCEEDLSTVTGDALGVLNVTDFEQKPIATCRNQKGRSYCKIGFVGQEKVDFEVRKQLLRRTAKSQ
jgi:hypothetical protein